MNTSGGSLDRKTSYWKEALAGAPTKLELPTDKPRPAVQSLVRATEAFEISDGLFSQLNAIGEAERATPFMTLAAAFMVLLNRYTGQDDILLAAPIQQNTIVLRSHLTDDLAFRELLEQVRDRTLGAHAHWDVPFARLVAELVPEPDPSHAPLCQVMFVYEEAGAAPARDGTPQCDLTLYVGETPGGIRAALEYGADLFEARTIQRLCAHFVEILGSIAADPAQCVHSLAMLTERERTQVLYEWNDTRAEIPATCVHRLFEEQVGRTPDAGAIVFEGTTLTYRELDERANRVAHYLRKQGIGPEVLVGVCLERCTELAVALLGVWKAGGAYVPLDPSLPKDRLAFMLKDAAAKVLVTDSEHRAAFDADAPPVVCIDTDWQTIERESASSPESGVLPANLAYVMYTSGSTGQPKGVMILHHGLVNYLLWAKRVYAAGSGDAVPVHSSIAFDLTVTGLYTPLIAGGRIEMLREDVGGQNLVASLRRGNDRSLVKITPAHLALLSEQLGADGVDGRTKLFVIGGENLLAESLVLWRDRAPATRLINEYGPTETVVGCCVYEVAPGDPRTGSVPIGRPIANTQLYILDRHMNPLPAGIVGELYIGGAGVARGYLNRPELTKERFLPDPFSRESGARMYKTGDLARYRPDGTLEYFGRVDNQVKVRGYRIELGEIEAKLADVDGVKASAVLAREDTPGNRQLVGYVVLRSDARLTANDLRNALGKSLPDYMVPSQLVFLDAMPLTNNGKVDRKALPAPSHETPTTAAGKAPARTPNEKKLVAIWQELLGLENIGVNDDFFELGGHSLQAIKAVTRIQEVFAVDLSPQALFDDPTIAGLARIVTEITGTGGAAVEAHAGPFFFGEPQLFAVYHPPVSDARDAAVLVCPSIGHEHTRGYRALQLLCDAAARAGFAAMRFDYSGVGDSSGDLATANAEQWCDDVVRAIDEIAARSGAREVHVVGLRIGAALAAAGAARAASRGAAIKSICVWDPLSSGGEFLAQASKFQHLYLRDTHRFAVEAVRKREAEATDVDDMLVGYPFPPSNRKALERIDLRRVDGWPSVPIRAVLSEPSGVWEDVAQKLAASGRAVETEVVDGSEASWSDYSLHEKTLRAGPVIERIVDRLSRGSTRGRP